MIHLAKRPIKKNNFIRYIILRIYPIEWNIFISFIKYKNLFFIGLRNKKHIELPCFWIEGKYFVKHRIPAGPVCYLDRLLA